MRPTKLLLNLIITSSLLLSVGFSQYIFLSGGDQSLKMFCPQQVDIYYDTDNFLYPAQGVILAMDFDPEAVQLNAEDFNFSILFQQGGIEPSLVAGLLGAGSRLFAQRGAINNGLPNNGRIGTLSFSSKRTTETLFSFYVVGHGFTDAGGDTDLYYNVGEDMLVYASGGQYSFLTGPCAPDAQAPVFGNFSPNVLATRTVNTGPRSRTPLATVPAKISSASGLTFEVYDGDDRTKNQPGYIAGSYPNLQLNDYRANLAGPEVYSPFNISDRASGIDPNSLHFSLSTTPTLFENTSPVVISPINGITRERRPRDYNISLATQHITPFEIEQEIIFSSSVEEFSSKKTSFVRSFNSPVNPWISDIMPYHLSQMALPLTDIRLRVRDDRSGVDPDDLVVTVLHGLTPLGVFSGADLHLTVVTGDANTPDYMIHIWSGQATASGAFVLPIPSQNFVSNTITVQVSVRDHKGNSPSNPNDRWRFDTRHSCASYAGCQDALTVYVWGSGGRAGTLYVGEKLYATGSASPGFPLLESGSTTLDCGPPTPIIYTGILITGAFLDNSSLYTGEKLYFEGGEVMISGDTIVFGDF